MKCILQQRQQMGGQGPRGPRGPPRDGPMGGRGGPGDRGGPGGRRDGGGFKDETTFVVPADKTGLVIGKGESDGVCYLGTRNILSRRNHLDN